MRALHASGEYLAASIAEAGLLIMAAKAQDQDKQTDGLEEESADLDIDLVEFHDEDFRDITTILKLSDTTKDKLTFSVFSLNIFVTCFVVGYVPNHFYIWHSLKAIVLLSYRWYAYKKHKFHYFLFDFCYFTNFLTLVYIWIPSSIIDENYRGELFTTCFSFAMGPLVSAIVLWRNSLVPHSTDKMTSLFIHISPSLTLWGIRWFGLPEQNFPICAGQTQPGPDGCQHVDFHHIVLNPMAFYVLWQICYILVVEIWRKKRVEERQYETSYKWIVEKAKQGFLYQLFGIFGPKYRKFMFILWQFVYTTAAILIGYSCYHSRLFGIILVFVVMAVACYNGASFYIDVFSQRYYFEKVLKGRIKSES